MSASKVVAVRMPERLHEQLVKVAKQERRTKSNLILVIVEEALKARADSRQQGG